MGTGGPVSSPLENGQTPNFVNAVMKLRIPYTWECSCVSWTGFLVWGEVLEYLQYDSLMRGSSWICQTCFSDEGNFFDISGRSPRMGYQTTYHKWQSKTKSTASLISWPGRHILNWHQCSSWQMLCVSDRGVNSSFSQYLKSQVTWFPLLDRSNPKFPSA
jgi:hypothetical protein